MASDPELQALLDHYRAMPPVAAMDVAIASADGDSLCLSAPLARRQAIDATVAEIARLPGVIEADVIYDTQFTQGRVYAGRVTVEDEEGEEREDGLTVSLEEPGLIQVTVEGRRVGPDIDGVEVGDVPFECRVSGEDLSVALRPDGTPEVYLARGRPLAFGGFMSSPPVNTCEYVPEGAR